MKQLPKIISNRLSQKLSLKEVLNGSKETYENALKQYSNNNINLKHQALFTCNTNKTAIGTSSGLTPHSAVISESSR